MRIVKNTSLLIMTLCMIFTTTSVLGATYTYVGTGSWISPPGVDYWGLGAGRWPGDASYVYSSSDEQRIWGGVSVTLTNALDTQVDYTTLNNGSSLTFGPGAVYNSGDRIRMFNSGGTVTITGGFVSCPNLWAEGNTTIDISGGTLIVDSVLAPARGVSTVSRYIVTGTNASILANDYSHVENTVTGVITVELNFDAGGISVTRANRNIKMGEGTDNLEVELNDYSSGGGAAVLLFLADADANGSGSVAGTFANVTVTDDGGPAFTLASAFDNVQLNEYWVEYTATTILLYVNNGGTDPDPAPEAIDDFYDGTLDGVLTNDASVLNNDIYAGVLTLSALEVDTTANGTLDLDPDGTFIYTPDTGFSGEDTFTYKAYTSATTSEVALVTIDVIDPEGIVANDDSYSGWSDVQLVVDAPGVLGNDDYTGTNTLFAYEVSGPANGTLSLNTNGSFTYTPDSGFIGTNSFTYEVYSLIRTSNVAQVTLVINDVEESLVANPDSYAGAVDEVLNVITGEGVLSNDEYAGPLALSALLGDTTTNGTLSLSLDGSFIYTPDPAFIGFDGFTYQAYNSAGTTSDVVEVTIETADPSIVNILLESDVAGNGISDISVVAGFAEVALPLVTSSQIGTGAGESWGGTGLTIGGSAVTFTTIQMTSATGAVHTVTNDLPRFSTDSNGMGMRSNEGDKWFLVDAQESFTWQADKYLAFEGIGIRAGFNGGIGNKSFTISSSDWIGLAGVVPGTGITYDSGSGTFTMVNIGGNVIGDDDILSAEEMVGPTGPSLGINTNASITFASTTPLGTDCIALRYASFTAIFTPPAPVLEIAAAEASVVVSWDGVSGGSYTLQSSPDLVIPVWSDEVTVTGAGPFAVTNDTTDPVTFYQVIAE